VRESFSSELKSHPDKPLFVHLRETGRLCREEISSRTLNFPESDELEDVAFILGVCHDFGKATRFFQEYLSEKNEKRKRKLKNNPRTKHGALSAVFTYFVLKEHFKYDSSQLKDSIIPLFGFLAVKRHHGNLKNPVKEISSLDEDTLEILVEQTSTLHPRVDRIYQELLGIDVEKFKNRIRETIGEIKREKRKIRRLETLRYYLLFQLLYSILVSSDKTEASGLKQGEGRPEIPAGLVDLYQQKRGWNRNPTGIDLIRNKIYHEVTGAIRELDLTGGRILSINVPTGTGKTLTSLSLALKLRERIKNELAFKPKIIYTLPFLSIIDQNFEVFEEVFNMLGETPSSLLLKHHHLTDTFYTTGEDEFQEEKAQFLIEGWNSEVIVTTFVQLFHTLVSSHNKALRKFHQIANSIVILDEIQAIPHKYWLLLRELAREVSEHLNTYFILVTATQPLIFNEEKGEIKELARNKKSYFKNLNRIQLHHNLQPLHLEEFKEKIKKRLNSEGDKDFLIVLNTINSARELYQSLEKKGDTSYYYLSTHITPLERLQRIQDIKNKKERKVIVSTQLIEAGVDIDVDIVIRDTAPLDSINQVAGRCNRNNTRRGRVEIYNLYDKKEYHKYIYSTFLIDKTRETLEEAGETIPETRFLELNNSYFQKVQTGMGNNESRELLEHLRKLQFEFLQEKFKLIDERGYEKIDVFVEIDARAHKVWQEYQNARETKDPRERRNRFLKIKKDFYSYVISVPRGQGKDLLDETTGIGHISQDMLETWYHPETGFQPKSPGSLII